MSRGNLNDVDLFRIAAMDVHDFVAIGFTSTGPSAKDDEVLSLAIADAQGNILFDQRMRPTRRKHWLSAKEARGITWEDVKDERELSAFADELRAIIGRASVVVGYNLPLLLGLLEADGVKVTPRETFDLRSEYALAYGRWSDEENDYAYASLSDCAKRYGYEMETRRAVPDAKALACVYYSFVQECRDEAGVERVGNRGQQRGNEAPERASGRHDDRKSHGGSGAHTGAHGSTNPKSSKGKVLVVLLILAIIAVLVGLYMTGIIGG